MNYVDFIREIIMDYEQLKLLVGQVMDLLVSQKYKELSDMTRTVRLSEEAIKSAITYYGKQLISPPIEAFKLMDVIPIQSNNAGWSVVMPLWTQEEGRSDLTIELTIVKAEGDFRVELDDIRAR
jgi:hypothetical protein